LLDIGSGSSAGVTQLTLKGGSTAGDYGIISIQNGSTQRGRIVADASTDHLRIDTAGGASTKIQFKTGASYTDAVTIDASQRVGIGVSAPSQKLTVDGNILTTSATGTDSFINVTTTGVQNTLLGFNNSGSTNGYGISNNFSYFGNGNAYGLQLTTNGSARLTIDSSGRVGIGSIGPTAILTVQKDGDVFHGQSAASSAPRIGMFTNSSAGTVGLFASRTDSIGFPALTFATSDTERARIDSSGRLLVGTSTARTNFFNLTNIGPALQVEGNGTANSSASLVRNSADSAPPSLILAKSRSTSYGVVSSGDALGRIPFMGADGSELVEAALIIAEVDGTPDANDMPGRLVFSTTADGASSPTERMRISNAGNLSASSTGSYSDYTARAHSFTSSGDKYVITADNQAGSGAVYMAAFRFSGFAPNNTSSRFLACFDNSADRLIIYSNGNVQNANNSYGSLSDVKLKENIVAANSQWSDIKALQVRNYNLKENPDHRQIGLVAQEAELVSPGLVYETPDRDEDGDETGEVTKGINYSVLYMKAVKALQEAMERIEALEAKVTALESQ
jgi:hypothetical protein